VGVRTFDLQEPRVLEDIMRTIREHRLLAVALVVPLVALSACGGDDDDAGATTAATAEEETEEETVEEETVEETVEETAAASPPTTVAAVTLPATVATTADTASTEPPTAEEVSIDPELAEVCALAAELNAQDGPPTEEQLAAYAELAPPEIADDVAAFIVAFQAADGDFGAVFADPAAGPAIEALTAFEAESCGLEAGGSEQDPSVTAIDPSATRVDLTASDYHFDLELPTDAGRYSFVMQNEGAEVHLMVLAELEEGVSLDEVMASEGEAGVVQMFESDIAPPGMEAVVTADLTPGRWVLVCPIPNAEGVAHAELGMVHEFTIG
jgi:hypothetical protein